MSVFWSYFLLVTGPGEDAAGLRRARAQASLPSLAPARLSTAKAAPVPGLQRGWGAGARHDTRLQDSACVSTSSCLSPGTNTVQISNVSRRETGQIVLRFRELLMVSREQDRSPSSAAGKAAAAPRRCRERSDPQRH